MRDGNTRKLRRHPALSGLEAFLDAYQARIVLLTGAAAGTEFRLETERTTLGRGPAVDVAFDDPAMSRQHAAVEFHDGAFRIRDLGSTNGLLLNGDPVECSVLAHGDRIEVGAYRFQVMIDERAGDPDTYEISAD